MDSSTHCISSIENLPPQIQLLRAQRGLYGRSRRLLVLQSCVTVVLPVAASISVFAWPHLGATAALFSLVVVLLDVTVLDPVQKRTRRAAAKVQEEFDCAVLDLPWDQFVVGDHVDAEEIHEAANARSGSTEQLENWYPPVVDELPLYLARIICQRINVLYDSRLRRRFGAYALATTIVISIALTIVGVVLRLPVDAFVLSVATPMTPVVLWGIKEFRRQREAAEASESIKEKAETLWANALSGKCSAEDCTAESRQFQNAIFDRRKSAPTIFAFVYRTMRSQLETSMSVGAGKLVGDAKIARGL